MQGDGDMEAVGLAVAAGRRMVGSADGDGGGGPAMTALNGDTAAGVAVIEGPPGHADGHGRANTAAERQAWADRIVGICKELVQIRDEGAEERLASGMRYEAYIQQRFGINARTLQKYLASYEQLGRQPDLYGQLLRDMGVNRTYALSIIRDMAPDVFAAFQEQPVAQQQATREHDLQGIIAQLKVERAQVLARQEDLNTVVTRLKMDLAAERAQAG
jgi:hypothetical protein